MSTGLTTQQARLAAMIELLIAARELEAANAEASVKDLAARKAAVPAIVDLEARLAGAAREFAELDERLMREIRADHGCFDPSGTVQ